MNYTPESLYRAMGRHFEKNGDEFIYSLDPKKRYSLSSIATMKREWSYRSEMLVRLWEDMKNMGLRTPKKVAVTMPRDTPEELEQALFRIREEVNRMTIRYRRACLKYEADQYEKEGDHNRAKQYLDWSMERQLLSDVSMSDDEDDNNIEEDVIHEEDEVTLDELTYIEDSYNTINGSKSN